MTDIKALHRSVFDAVQSHDVEKVSEIYHPEATYVTPDGDSHEAQSFVKEVFRSFGQAFPDLSIEILHHHILGDKASIVEYTFSGTHTGDFEGIAPTERHIKVPACSVVEVSNGMIIHERDYYDNALLLNQLGVIEA